MTKDTLQSEQPIQAVFSVCATQDLAAVAGAACAEVIGSSFAGEFPEYFTGERRPQFPALVKQAEGCVALVDCEANPELALDTMQRLQTLSLRNLRIIGFAASIDATYLLQAMRAGCTEFFAKPADPALLAKALRGFQNHHIPTLVTEKVSGRVISFFGSKGGVGTTTLAVHLANNLVRRHHKRVLLIDHHDELGHVALYLGLKDTQYHFDQLIRNVERLDAELLGGFVARHTSGLEVLASPDMCALHSASGQDEIQRVMEFLRTQYDYVIVDSSMNYRDTVGPILRASDEVCLISTPDVAALRDLARRVEHLSLASDAASKLRIIINRSTSDDAVTAEQIEGAVRFPVWMTVPNSYAELLRAINAGEPIHFQHRSAFAQQMMRFASKFVSTTATGAMPTPMKKRFSFWPIRNVKAA
jgi:pilus assembly protein CpaE